MYQSLPLEGFFIKKHKTMKTTVKKKTMFSFKNARYVYKYTLYSKFTPILGQIWPTQMLG